MSTENDSKKRFPISTIVNFGALLLLFALIFAIQHFGQKKAEETSPPQVQNEITPEWKVIPAEKMDPQAPTPAIVEADTPPPIVPPAGVTDSQPVATTAPQVLPPVSSPNLAAIQKPNLKINKFAPSPFPLPQGERVRERVTTEPAYTGLNSLTTGNQNQLTGSKNYLASQTGKLSLRPAPKGDFIPFEKKK